MAYAEVKQHAHELIDRMSPGQVPVAVELLEKMLDPVSLEQANAPFEDETIGEEEEQAVTRARLETRPPTDQSHKEFIAEFGLTMDDWERMGETPLEPFDQSH